MRPWTRHQNKKRWIVVHHHSADGDGDYKVREFDDGIEMLKHIARHSHIPGFGAEKEK